VNILQGLKPRDYWSTYLLIKDRVKLPKFSLTADDIRLKYLVDKMKLKREETLFSYIKRVKKVLPNFPRQVIKTWLFEHNGQLDEILEQPVERFIFRKSYISLQSIINYEPQFKSPIDQNLKQLNDPNYQRAMKDSHYPMTRILKYLKQYGVWPGHPIIMDTSKDKCDYLVNGYPLNKPFDVLEGFRRFSVVKFYIGSIGIEKSLRIYSVSLSSQKC
jgi:hypothetical protein